MRSLLIAQKTGCPGCRRATGGGLVKEKPSSPPQVGRMLGLCWGYIAILETKMETTI